MPISIAIAAYNAGSTLEATLGSVLAQTYADWEAIVVDDGSTDGTADIAEAFCRRDSRFRLVRIRPEDKQPFPASRNRAAAECRGDWIAVLDADDLWEPTKLAEQWEATQARPDTLLSFHQVRIMQGTREIGRMPINARWDEVTRRFGRALMVDNPVPHSSVLVRREAFEAIGGYEPTLSSNIDWDLYIRLYKRFGDRFLYVPRPLGRYVLHETNLSHDSDRSRRNRWRVIRRTLGGGWWLRHPGLCWAAVQGGWRRDAERCEGWTARRAAMLQVAANPLASWRWRELQRVWGR